MHSAKIVQISIYYYFSNASIILSTDLFSTNFSAWIIVYSNNNVQLLYNKEYAYIMDKKQSIDIDTEDDFDYAVFLHNRIQ